MVRPKTKYSIETEHEADGRWLAEIRNLPGAMAYGKRKREAMRAAIALAKNHSMKHATKAKSLYERADKEWSRGRMQSAFRLFLAAAKAGHVPAFHLVGQFYDFGSGVKFNERAALYWYRRAARHGDSLAAANNIGCILRDQNKLTAALRWFRRAVKCGDTDANLDIAKLYLHRKRDSKTATRYLKAVCKSKNTLDQSKEQAEQMLHDLKIRLHTLEPLPSSHRR